MFVLLNIGQFTLIDLTASVILISTSMMVNLQGICGEERERYLESNSYTNCCYFGAATPHNAAGVCTCLHPLCYNNECILCFALFSLFTMIRREPTLIPMTDSDVQDVRDKVAKQKAEMASHQALISKMKRLADNPNMTNEDREVYEQMKKSLNERNKAKRLGLDAGENLPFVRVR